ncbi:thiopeptide-type bacteriocin biosynthesis protein [Streptomyces sp. NRRL F-5053]|uniref:thiopeptide-type bacteriocin biosynthesis protein n=1 Tax=Streptomyces sp. NRRL F-5053 TaxID=1463854 RepID=UPI0004C4B865|nr:thiopeptide-type bacteriocin biosynthesis protein [Streptomyces sp. NRRL F-5053]
MPTDRLNPPAPLEATLAAVQDVLAGASPVAAAARSRLDPADLIAAVAVYQQAGAQALARQALESTWRQLYVHFTDWAKAEQIAAEHLVPVLDLAEGEGLITGWWFVRKHPCWRMRLLLPGRARLPPALAAALDELAADKRVTRWWPGIYEPETAAFGGETGMAIAHALFHADSRAVLTPPQGDLGRREMSLLLCATLMRAAGLEWYEQADVWHRVAQERPLPPDVPAAKIHTMTADLRHLLLADTRPTGPMLQSDQVLKHAADRVQAFRHAGQALGTANRDGALDRGLRQVVAYHVIFHWNRIGLHARAQSALAHAACAAILHSEPDAQERPAP